MKCRGLHVTSSTYHDAVQIKPGSNFERSHNFTIPSETAFLFFSNSGNVPSTYSVEGYLPRREIPAGNVGFLRIENDGPPVQNVGIWILCPSSNCEGTLMMAFCRQRNDNSMLKEAFVQQKLPFVPF